MAKRSRKKRRRRRNRDARRARARRQKRSQALTVATADGARRLRLRLRIHALELAKGHDGFLRGAPEPVLMLGVYCIDPRGARVVGRYLYRFERPPDFPCKVATIEPSQEEQSFVRWDPATLVIVALAVEEDSGSGVQELFAGLEHGDTLVVWADDGDTPTPLHLSELQPGWTGVNDGRPIHVMLDGKDPAESLPGDDWIAANLIVTDDALRRRQNLRLGFVSADTRNDWTAQLELAIRPG